VNDQPNPQWVVTTHQFLKTCQLWEKVCKGYERLIEDDWREWNGYWWRLVEDNNKEKTMSEYKKGNLVRKVKGSGKGCVGKYVGKHGSNLNIELPQISHPGTFLKFWPKEDCEPVVEKKPADAEVMDLDKIAWEGIQKAAEESTWMPEEYCMNDWLSDVQDFLRNGPRKQLADTVLREVFMTIQNISMDANKSNNVVRHEIFALAGKALENSKPVDPQGWITDRRPTEKDADKDGMIFVIRPDGSWDVWNFNDRQLIDGEWPWQPVPQCLLTHPKPEPKCKSCIHLRSVSFPVLEARAEYCRAADKWYPNPGVVGCDFGKK
jgi:hypothetical protein